MPKFTSVEALFARTPEGWTFNSSYPRFFGRPWTYLLTEAQKEALEQRLNRGTFVLLLSVFVLLAALVAFVQFRFPDFVDRLEAGSPPHWLILCALWIAVTGAVVLSALFFVRYRGIAPVLRDARRIGPAQPDWLGFILLLEMIKRHTERKSARVLIIWIALLLLLSAYGTIVEALIPARSALVLFGNVVSWLATLWYAALLAFKLRAQRLGP